MSDRITIEWSHRVAAEYRSAALTAQVLHWSVVAAFPEALLHTALRVVRDELDHAALSHACLVELGGADVPVPLDATALAEPTGEGVLAALVDSVVKNFCLGETFAVPLFDAMRRSATHPAVRPVITRVLKDEAIHRQFGWDALDELLARDPGVAARITARLPDWLGGFRAAYAPDAGDRPLTDEERAAGLLDLDRYRDVFWSTVRGDVARQLGRRGLALPDGFR